MNNYSKYLAIALELPGLMLALAYLANWYDGPQQKLGGYGLLFGLGAALVLWIVHVMILAKKSEND